MENSGDAALSHGFGQDLRRIALRLARMHDQRQPGLPRGIDMRFEPLALRRAVRLVVIIIEAALADRNHPRMVRGFDQRRCAEVGMRIGLMRVYAHACPDIRLALGDLDDVLPFALPGRDVENSR